MQKTSFLLAATLVFSLSAHAVNNTIPEQFHGFWEEPSMCKVALELGVPNTGSIISATEVQGYGTSCEVIKTSQSTANSIQADLSCMQEGETYNTSVQLNLNNSNLTTTFDDNDSSTPFVRCE